MSAAEVIEQIKALPPAEQNTVAEFIRSLPATESLGEQSTVRYANPEQARIVSQKIFAENEWPE